MKEVDDGHASRVGQWDEQWPTQDGDQGGHGGNEPDTGDELTTFPNIVGTDDPLVSVRDAEPYVPPIDPPVIPGGREGIHVGVGFGTDTLEESAPSGDESIHDACMLALGQDALTMQLSLSVKVSQGVVRLFGQVMSIDDAEYAQTLLGNLPHVIDVEDATTLMPTGTA